MNQRARKGARYLKSLNFTSWMWLALAGVVGLSVHFTMLMDEGRQLPADYDQLDQIIADLEYDIANLSVLAPLPLLESQWRLLAAKAQLAGVKMEVVPDPVSFGFDNTYMGPLKNWAAVLSGDPRVVLALAQELQKEIPIFLYDYSVDSEAMKLNVVVVGI
ncbi:hypothetical protein QAO71_17600 (plasmid) [Halopseudomonas sp. SMJS2]|uniref:hypothetical protein n=1 Tax=Halopseudomonas sp. SMJS2 TaxID=3041098 RepID=UPI002453383B|nr:hypothetical protein [Halopseudomonas sp. SMJS2]WGK63357.1 hypothetical protein QAO71_17600 [Halopseudomonas sp. SMJS2]